MSCKGPLSNQAWRLAWEREGRTPAWVRSTPSRKGHNPFGGNKYLWGNTPAIDILQLERNEGVPYVEHIALLFAGESAPPIGRNI